MTAIAFIYLLMPAIPPHKGFENNSCQNFSFWNVQTAGTEARVFSYSTNFLSRPFQRLWKSGGVQVIEASQQTNTHKVRKQYKREEGKNAYNHPDLLVQLCSGEKISGLQNVLDDVHSLHACIGSSCPQFLPIAHSWAGEDCSLHTAALPGLKVPPNLDSIFIWLHTCSLPL